MTIDPSIGSGRTTGLVLAGGRSSRMGGRDKALMMLGGRPLIAHVLDRLSALDHVSISANGDLDDYRPFGFPILRDRIEGFAGPLAGIDAGLAWASAIPGVTHLLTVAADTPFFPTDLAQRMEAQAIHAPDRIIHAASLGRSHPTFSLWPVALAAPLSDWLATGRSRKLTGCIASFPNEACGFDAPDGRDPFFNINTPDDLERAEERLRS